MTNKSVIAGVTLVSKEGATFRVYRVELTPEGNAMLTTGLTRGIPSSPGRDVRRPAEAAKARKRT